MLLSFNKKFNFLFIKIIIVNVKEWFIKKLLICERCLFFMVYGHIKLSRVKKYKKSGLLEEKMNNFYEGCYEKLLKFLNYCYLCGELRVFIITYPSIAELS